jgi:hypothetical protein
LKFPHEFLVTFAAVMSANLLTIAFIWAMFETHKAEKEKREFGQTTHKVQCFWLAFPLVFTAGAFYLIGK